MILANINFLEKIKKPENFLRIFLALVFLSAGVYRIFNPAAASLEFDSLFLPGLLSPIMIVFEIGAGLLLIFNRYTRPVYYSLLIFMVIVLSWALILRGKGLFEAAGELFVFNLNPTDFFLHFIFLIIVLVLLRFKK